MTSAGREAGVHRFSATADVASRQGKLEAGPLAPLARVAANRARADLLMSAVYFAIGFMPIGTLALAILEVLPLSVGTLLLVLPAALLGIVLGVRRPRYGALALKGLAVGLIAVFLYDMTRFPFILLGLWGDFIPKIAEWLLNTTEPNFLVGYFWRYLGNGAGMGMAFTVAFILLRPKVHVRLASLAYGVGIWMCLMATLILAPHGQELMFTLTPTTVALSLLGHVVYGLTIGALLSRNFMAASTDAVLPAPA